MEIRKLYVCRSHGDVHYSLYFYTRVRIARSISERMPEGYIVILYTYDHT